MVREALIERLEAQARLDLPAYRRRLAFLVALGYSYIVLVLLLTVGLMGALILLLSRLKFLAAIQFLWPALLFVGALVRGLWVRFPPPNGIPLDPGAYPALARIVEEAGETLEAPPIHRMLLTGDANAAVVQVPRLTLMGWPENYLLLGQPLLQNLSVEEARAVIVHELGHVSNADGVLGSWIYRTRAAWAQLAQRLQGDRHVGGAVLRRFFAWYQPRFEAYSFVAGRTQERQADAWAARLVGSRQLADALARLAVLGQVLVWRYWPAIYARAASLPEPAGSPFTKMAEAVQPIMESAEGGASLEVALGVPTTHDDTHPCLRERLETLGEAPRLSPAPAPSAWDALLGAEREELSAQLDAEWAQATRKGWTDTFESMQRATKRLARLDSEGGPPMADAGKALELTFLREAVHGITAALPYYRTALAAHPSDGRLRLALARALLESDQDECIEALQPLFEDPQTFAIPAHGLACEFYRRRGQGEAARQHMQKAIELDRGARAGGELDRE